MRSRALALPLATLAVFVAAEVGFRLRYFGVDALARPWAYTATPITETDLIERVADPLIVWRLRPDLAARFKGTDLVTNSGGFRGPEIPRQARPGTFRIATVGASITMGSGVAEVDAYPRRLEAWLHAHGRPDVEVLNVAIAGYQPAQAAALYETYVAPYAPDAVTIPFYEDEFDAGTPAIPRPLPGPGLHVRSALERLFLYRALREAMQDRVGRHLALDWSRRARRAGDDGGGDGEDDARSGRVKTHVVFARFVEKRQREGIPVYVALLPKTRAFKAERHARFVEQVERWAARLPGAKIVDVRGPIGDAIEVEDRIYPGDDHPDARAQRRIGDTFGEQLLPLLPPARR